MGHNTGLGHSSAGSDQYGDRTCMMGSARSVASGNGVVCFNAANQYKVGLVHSRPCCACLELLPPSPPHTRTRTRACTRAWTETHTHARAHTHTHTHAHATHTRNTMLLRLRA